MAYQLPRPGSSRPSLTKANSQVFMCAFCSYQNCKQSVVREHTMAKHMPPQPQAHVPSSSGDNITMAKPSHPKATSTPKHAKRPLNPYKKLQVEATKSKKTEAYPCKRCPYVGINKRASTTHQKSHEVDPAKKRKTSTYQKGLMS